MHEEHIARLNDVRELIESWYFQQKDRCYIVATTNTSNKIAENPFVFLIFEDKQQCHTICDVDIFCGRGPRSGLNVLQAFFDPLLYNELIGSDCCSHLLVRYVYGGCYFLSSLKSSILSGVGWVSLFIVKSSWNPLPLRLGILGGAKV